MKRKIILTVLLILFVLSVLTACNFNRESIGNPNENTEAQFLLSDYVLPNNFNITIQISDSAIVNPGEPWYYKTAKIGNDWQIIGYDRDLADKSKQVTYFFKYVSEDNYLKYSYNYDDTKWDAKGKVNFKSLVATSYNNFLFLYEKPNEPQIEVTETEVKYDVDPTTTETLIDAVKYEYTDYFETEIIVDKAFLNVCLYKCEYADKPLTYRAYEYTKDNLVWGSTNLNAKFFKPAP